METALFNSKSKEDLKLLISIAKKMGLTVTLLTDEDKEDMGLLNAMNKGKTGKHIDTESFLSKLKK
jgi:hypothetical protein